MNREKVARIARDLVTMTAQETQAVIGTIQLQHNRALARSVAQMLGTALEDRQACDDLAAGQITLVHHGDKKIQVIKWLRQYTGLGLKEAKLLSESGPVVLAGEFVGFNIDMKAEDRVQLFSKLMEVGAKVKRG